MNSTWNIKGMLFFFHASMTIIISYMPVYFQYLGLSGSEIGILLAVGPAAAILAQPFWGFISDKYKTVKRIMLLCLSVALAVAFIVFQLTEFIILVPVMFLFFSFQSPAGGLGESLGQKVSVEHGVSFGSIRMWGSLGFATSSLAGGFILTHIGIWNIYYVYATMMIIALTLTFFAPDSRPSKKPVYLTGAVKLLRNKKLVMFLLFIFTISLTHRMNDSFIGLFVVELGGNESFIGMVWFVGVFAEAMVFMLSAYWMHRFHPLTNISIAAFLYTLRWLLMFLINDPFPLLFIQVLHGLTFGIFYLTAFQFVTRLLPEEFESTGHLLFISVFFGISGVVGSVAGGQIINAYDVQSLYLVMSVLAAIGLFSSFLYRFYYQSTVRSAA